MPKKRKGTRRTPDQIRHLRVNNVGPLGQHFPGSAQVLVDLMFRRCKERSLGTLTFSLNELPTSVNHQYAHSRFSTRLVPEVKTFRTFVALAMGYSRTTWKPKGATCAIIFLESPLWLTMERKVRQMDADNFVKPIFDAYQEATNVPDELMWEFHVYKVASKRSRTTVYMFDLGDVVDFHVG